MRVPSWLAFIIAGAVILFGIYRLYLAFGGPSDEDRQQHRRGLYAMSRFQHGLIGVLFLLVGGSLLATALGWNPFASEQAPQQEPQRPRGNHINITPGIELPPAADPVGGREVTIDRLPAPSTPPAPATP